MAVGSPKSAFHTCTKGEACWSSCRMKHLRILQLLWNVFLRDENIFFLFAKCPERVEKGLQKSDNVLCSKADGHRLPSIPFQGKGKGEKKKSKCNLSPLERLGSQPATCSANDQHYPGHAPPDPQGSPRVLACWLGKGSPFVHLPNSPMHWTAGSGNLPVTQSNESACYV